MELWREHILMRTGILQKTSVKSVEFDDQAAVQMPHLVPELVPLEEDC